ncbi:hypothetical protein [Sporosarcina sp. NPDC096371]|uniref:hypothetical protein n=1 Tax=Sporosarcina sp. NPDC096371 TaxID=3364530 RepID=UPI0038241093
MNFINQHTKIAAEQTIDMILSLTRKIGIVSLAITIFSTISFLTTYSFLFGYYFGGEIDNSFSNFEIIRRVVPFHINTITFTYLMIVLSVTLVTYLLSFLFKKGILFKIVALLFFLVFHFILTVYFTREIKFESILQFSAIWSVAGIIGGMILCFIRGIRAPGKTFTGALFGAVIIIIFGMFYPRGIAEEWLLIWVNVVIFGFGTLFSMVPFKKHLNFIFIFPYIFVLEIVIITLTSLKLLDFIQGIIVLLIPLLISIVLSYSFRKNFKGNITQTVIPEEERSIKKTILEVVLILLNPKTHKAALTFIIIMLLMAYVMTPRVSTATAKIIRSFTPPNEFQLDKITVKDFEGGQKIILGIIVAEQDNVLYISNEKRELEQIKVDSYYVERVNN